MNDSTVKLPAHYDHVGSFLRPKYLLEARDQAARGIIKSDAFSYTQSGRFVPYEYLSDLLLYAAHRLADDGLIVDQEHGDLMLRQHGANGCGWGWV